MHILLQMCRENINALANDCEHVELKTITYIAGLMQIPTL